MRHILTITSLIIMMAATPSHGLQDKLEPKGTIPQEGVGLEVAVENGLVAVGAPFHTLSNRTGGVFIFRRDPVDRDHWLEADRLFAADGVDLDRFGYAIDMDDGVLAIGAPYDHVGNDTDAGSVYIFRPDPTIPDSWNEAAKITSDDVIRFDLFGSSVALDGDTLVAGAPGDFTFGSKLGGAAYVFERVPGPVETWQQVARLRAPAGHPVDSSFGQTVALDGDVIVVGSSGTVDSQTVIGGAFVYYRDQGGANQWGLVAQLDSGNTETNEWFGLKLAFEGDTALVAAQGHEPNDDGVETGAVYVFERNADGPDQWGLVHKIVPTDGNDNDRFGRDLAFDGEVAVISATGDDPNGVGNAGSVYFYHATYPHPWAFISRLTAFELIQSDAFGFSVDVDGDIVATGSDHASLQTSNAYVSFDLHIPEPSLDSLFTNGFESGDLTAWSDSVP